MKRASMISIGAYVPSKILTNFDLEKMVETSDEWIVKRTGIHTRHIADDEATSDLAVNAAKLAIKRSGLNLSDIDCVLCATITPDYFCMPSTACIVADKLGLPSGIMAFDISAACSGFIYAIQISKALIESGIKQNILIIGAEKLSSIVNWEDRSTCVLFGDGAGAAVISARDDNEIIDVHTASDGGKANLLITPAPGSANPISQKIIDENLGYVHMNGNEVFKIAVNTLTADVVDILEKNRIEPSKIDLFIPHQANLRIIEAVKTRLDFSDDQCIVTVGKYGNTSSASIPMAINDSYESGKLKNGSLMLLDAFGGGFTWGSALLKFGGK